MKTHSASNQPRASRLITAAAAAVLLAVAAAGITALNHTTANAIHPLAAGPPTPVQRAASLTPPRESQSAASDASVPSASEVFRGRSASGVVDSPPTF